MKKFIVPFLCAAGILPAIASPVTPEQALARVMEGAPSRIKASALQGARLAHTVMSPASVPTIYIFNNPGKGGFIVASADDAVTPLLGYCDKGSFSADAIGPELEWWLGEYSRQIEAAALSPAAPFAAPPRREGREAIPPMIKTEWDQIAPYNSQCPLSGTERTWTGCVATSMAQVMNYWQYPERGKGTISYTIESLEKKVSLNLDLKPFAWDDMLPIYLRDNYTEAQADAVAYLMKACGYSVKMEYSLDSSGALGMNVPRALTKYFGYDPGLLYTLRQYYSSTEWDEMMYTNLRDCGPVIYGGGSELGGGHSFICDGYDGEGYYHFNWGWSGMSDGYFALDALNPGALGSGGGTGGGYNFSQDAIFGIRPATGNPGKEQPSFLTQTASLLGELSAAAGPQKDYLSFSLTGGEEGMWVNYTPNTLKLKFSLQIAPASGGDTIYRDLSNRRFEIKPGYGTSPEYFSPAIDLSSLNLPDGEYTLTVGTCPIQDNVPSPTDDGAGWVAVKPYYGCSNNVALTVNGKRFSVKNAEVPVLKVTGKIMTDLYYACNATYSVTATNDSDIEITSGFAPAFANSLGLMFLGESIKISVPPHSSVTREWTSSLSLLQQIFGVDDDLPLAFTFFNECNYSFYSDQFMETVVMKPNPGNPTLSFSEKPAIVGARKETVGNGINHQVIYMAPDPENIEVTARLRLDEGYFGYPVVACLCVPYNSDQVEILLTGEQNIFMTQPGEETDVDITLSYPSYDPDATYFLVMAYAGKSGLTTLPGAFSFRIEDLSGVAINPADEGLTLRIDSATGDIVATSPAGIASLQAFDLSGMPVSVSLSSEGNSVALHPLCEGPVIVLATDNAGATKSLKSCRR